MKILLVGWALCGQAAFVLFMIEILGSESHAMQTLRDEARGSRALPMAMIGLCLCLIAGPLGAWFALRVVSE